MNVAQALSLKVGQQVRVPADRGEPAYIGKVAAPTLNYVHKSHQGIEYVHVTVERNRGRGTSSGWPSNRLGYMGPQR